MRRWEAGRCAPAGRLGCLRYFPGVPGLFMVRFLFGLVEKEALMKAMVLDQICDLSENRKPLRAVEMPDPEPGDKQIRIRIAACGVCHTELDEIEGRTPPPKFPVVFGHEVVGRVDRLGPGVSSWKRPTGRFWSSRREISGERRCWFCKRQTPKARPHEKRFRPPKTDRGRMPAGTVGSGGRRLPARSPRRPGLRPPPPCRPPHAGECDGAAGYKSRS